MPQSYAGISGQRWRSRAHRQTEAHLDQSSLHLGPRTEANESRAEHADPGTCEDHERDVVAAAAAAAVASDEVLLGKLVDGILVVTLSHDVGEPLALERRQRGGVACGERGKKARRELKCSADGSSAGVPKSKPTAYSSSGCSCLPRAGICLGTMAAGAFFCLGLLGRCSARRASSSPRRSKNSWFFLIFIRRSFSIHGTSLSGSSGTSRGGRVAG